MPEAEPGMSAYMKMILNVLPGKAVRRSDTRTTRGGRGRGRMKQRLRAGTSAPGALAVGCWV